MTYNIIRNMHGRTHNLRSKLKTEEIAVALLNEIANNYDRVGRKVKFLNGNLYVDKGIVYKIARTG